MAYDVSNFLDNDDVSVIAERGPFKVIQYDRDLSCTPEEAMIKYYMSQMYVTKKQLVCDTDKASVILSPGKMQWTIGILQINDADRFKQILVDYYESTSDRLKDFLKECIIRSSPVEFIVHDGAEYAVQDIISELPFSVRSQYQTDKECAMDFIEAYLAGKQC